jgi:hypothetical protein
MYSGRVSDDAAPDGTSWNVSKYETHFSDGFYASYWRITHP